MVGKDGAGRKRRLPCQQDRHTLLHRRFGFFVQGSSGVVTDGVSDHGERIVRLTRDPCHG